MNEKEKWSHASIKKIKDLYEEDNENHVKLKYSSQQSSLRILGIVVFYDIDSDFLIIEYEREYLIIDTTLLPSNHSFRAGSLIQIIGDYYSSITPFVKYHYSNKLNKNINDQRSVKKGILQYNQFYFRSSKFLNNLLISSFNKDALFSQNPNLPHAFNDSSCYLPFKEYDIPPAILEELYTNYEKYGIKELQNLNDGKRKNNRNIPISLYNFITNTLMYNKLLYEYLIQLEKGDKLGRSNLSKSESLNSIYDEEIPLTGESNEFNLTQYTLYNDSQTDSNLTKQLIEEYNSKYQPLKILRARIIRPINGLDTTLYFKSIDLLHEFLSERKRILK